MVENENKDNRYAFMNNFSEETNNLLNKYLPDSLIMRNTNNALINTNEFIRSIDQKNYTTIIQNSNVLENQFSIVRDLKNTIDVNYERFKEIYNPNENQISLQLFLILSDIKNKIDEAESLIKK